MKRFKKFMVKLVEEGFAFPLEKSIYQFEIMTLYGVMYVSASKGMIARRFVDPKWVNNTGLITTDSTFNGSPYNRNSGKWNITCDNSDKAFAIFVSDLAFVLPHCWRNIIREIGLTSQSNHDRV